MKKVILGGMLLSLLTGMCFAQRGGARSMGTVGPNARMAPNVGMAPDARPLPNARNVGSNIGTADSNIGSGTHAKAVGPDSVAGANARTVAPDATTAPDTGPNPQ
jgi:hypothetical protein